MTAPALNVAIQGQGEVSADNINSFVQSTFTAISLRAFVGVPGMCVFVQGAAAPNDSGAGTMAWNPSGTGPDDGVTNIVPVGIPIGCWTRVSQSNVPASGIVTIATVAALKAIVVPVLSNNLLYYVQGYFTPGDGGGGFFRVTTTNPGADNGGTIIWSSSTGFYFLRQYSGAIDLRWFGCQPGAGDNTVQGNKCFSVANGAPVFISAGTYLGNFVITVPLNVSGAGSLATILTPFNTALAAIEYYKDSDFGYPSTVEGVSFSGSGTGTGFCFGHTDTANYVAGDELANLVTFRNCRFTGLTKGLSAQYGNIGLQFYDCQWQSNYYGVYCLNNKFSGSIMQAGTKFFKNGEFSANSCAFYLNNTQDGFGQIEFDGTVFESNFIAAYVYNAASYPISPISWKNYWSEANGLLATSPPSTVTLDTWAGAVKSTFAFPNKTWIFDGAFVRATFEKGFFSDCWLKATNSFVTSKDDRVESNPGFGGGANVVAAASPFIPTTNPASRILITDFTCDDGGGQQTWGLMTEGTVFQIRNAFNTSGSGAFGRANIIAARAVIAAHSDFGGVSVSCNAQANLAGDVAVTGTVVAQGSLFANANSYSGAFTNGQHSALAGSSMSLTAGWWAVTVDIQVTAGAPQFSEWDLGVNQFFVITPIADSQWITYGGVGFLPSGTPTTALWVSGTSGLSVTQSFLLRNYQKKAFSNLQDAQEFLKSRIYAT